MNRFLSTYPKSVILKVMPTQTSTDLQILAADVLSKALKAGATDAEAVVYEGDEFSSLVRLGQVETLKESGSRAVGLRVFIGQRTASTSSSDFSPESITRWMPGRCTFTTTGRPSRKAARCTCPSEATAAKMALTLRKNGIYRVRPLRGGFDEWKRLGYPLEDIPGAVPAIPGTMPVVPAVCPDVFISCHWAAHSFMLLACTGVEMRAGANAATRMVEAINKADFIGQFSLWTDQSVQSAAKKTQEPAASEMHFFVKLVCAAPCSFCAAAWSLQHFFAKLVSAAPCSFLPVAWI